MQLQCCLICILTAGFVALPHAGIQTPSSLQIACRVASGHQHSHYMSVLFVTAVVTFFQPDSSGGSQTQTASDIKLHYPLTKSFLPFLSHPSATNISGTNKMRRLLLTMWFRSCLSIQHVDGWSVSFCHRRVTMVMMGDMLMLKVLRKITPIHQSFLHKNPRWEVFCQQQSTA